jgi:hypothetical protein
VEGGERAVLTESVQTDKLEADIRKLHGCLMELSRIRHAGPVWVSAGSVAVELENILAKKERRPG